MSTPSADAVGKENGAAVVENGREDDHPAAAMQNGGYESERRAQRRQRHELEKEEAKQWDIIKSMSDISAEVELLTQEVCLSLCLCGRCAIRIKLLLFGYSCSDSRRGRCLISLQRHVLRP